MSKTNQRQLGYLLQQQIIVIPMPASTLCIENSEGTHSHVRETKGK